MTRKRIAASMYSKADETNTMKENNLKRKYLQTFRTYNDSGSNEMTPVETRKQIGMDTLHKSRVFYINNIDKRLRKRVT